MGRWKSSPPPLTGLVAHTAQEKKLDQELLDGLDWPQVYRLWRERMEDFAAPMQPLFEEVVIEWPKDSREPDLVWWPRRTFRKKLLSCRRHFESRPGTLGPTHPIGAESKGQLHTLYLLDEFEGNLEKQAAVMISASLLGRMVRRRDNYPEYWPPIRGVQMLREMVRDVWREAEYDWHHASTSVLPVYTNDRSYRIGNHRSLVRYLAEEHAALLHQQVPTRVIFSSSPAPHLHSV